MPSSRARWAGDLERVPADVRHLHRSAAAASSGPSAAPSPGSRAPRRCPRTATAGRGRCRAAARRRRPPSESSRATRRRATRSRRSGRRPGRRSRAAPSSSAGRRRREELRARPPRSPCAPRSGCRRRSRSARWCVTHSSPFVLGITFASRRSREHAMRSARANALNSASIWWWLGPAVEHLQVHVGARALGEALEEVGEQLRLQIADALRPSSSQIDDGVGAAAEIDRRDAERLVHRHHEVAGAIDAAPRCRAPPTTASPSAMPTSSTV